MECSTVYRLRGGCKLGFDLYLSGLCIICQTYPCYSSLSVVGVLIPTEGDRLCYFCALFLASVSFAYQFPLTFDAITHSMHNCRLLHLAGYCK